VLTPGQKVDLVKMQLGGMKGVFLAVFVGQRRRSMRPRTSPVRLSHAAVSTHSTR